MSGENVEVNSLEPAEVIALEASMKSYKAVAQPQPLPSGMQAKKPTTHEDEKIALVLFLTGGFTIWNIFPSTCHYHFGSKILYVS